ncbi:MAG: CDGSH iron-sulfur domain-containing protein [Leptospirales bacterium]
METPHIADKKPIVMTLAPGKYYWCQCGLSETQPLCDDSHGDTPFTPKMFVVTERKPVALCQCKRTGNAPFCDGTHASL